MANDQHASAPDMNRSKATMKDESKCISESSGSSLKLQCPCILKSWKINMEIASFKVKDWRRVAHSAKVGLALALVSLSVLLQDVFDTIGHNALWAILTVVVIFEYTVGATLSKGLNRGLGTIMAASLGLFVDYLANFMGTSVEPFIVGFSVFIVGMTTTYTRFVPSIKAKYDYGVMIFLLTFCLVVVSGYKVADNIDLVFDRVVTVMVGVIICLLVSIFVFPIWAGDDLHKLVLQNCEGLARSLEECLHEYFEGVQRLSRISSKICKGQPFDDKIYKAYRGILISKQTEESLANFASWEPRKGHFGCLYPWKRLVEVGAILRHCAYAVSALHGCVLSEIQAPESLKKVFAEACIRTGEEVARMLRTVASDMKAKRRTKPKQCLLGNTHHCVQVLHNAVRRYPHFFPTSRPGEIPNHPDIKQESTISPDHLQVADSTIVNPSLNPNHRSINGSSSDLPPAMADIQSPNFQFSSAHVSFPTSPSPALQEAAKEADKRRMTPPTVHGCNIEFAESLSIASLITILMEIVTRVEHLLEAVTEFQEQAGFCEGGGHSDDDDFVDINVDADHTRHGILNHPSSTTQVE